jgi:MEKHLA domain-containing protein
LGQFIRLPSRFSTEPTRPGGTRRLLAGIPDDGLFDDYQGVRIAKDGPRFRDFRAVLSMVIVVRTTWARGAVPGASLRGARETSSSRGEAKQGSPLFAQRKLFLKELFERHGAVMFFISRRIDKGDCPLAGAAPDFLKQVFFFFQLLPVTLLEPLRPRLNFGLFLADASWPEPLNQYSETILSGRFFVSAF